MIYFAVCAIDEKSAQLTIREIIIRAIEMHRTVSGTFCQVALYASKNTWPSFNFFVASDVFRSHTETSHRLRDLGRP